MTAAPTLRRWLVFNVVGGLGVVVQLSALAALTLEAGMHYLLATGLAVEIAVVHNFIWHQCWTWRDRAGRESQAGGKGYCDFRFRMEPYP